MLIRFLLFRVKNCTLNDIIVLGLKSADYPKDTNEQSAKAVELVKDLVARVMGRDEAFSLIVRKSAQRRYAKDSTLVLVPPIEVSKQFRKGIYVTGTIIMTSYFTRFVCH